MDEQSQQSVAPKTTAEQDLTTASQRKINFIWEFTQSAISILVVVSNMIVAVHMGLVSGPHPEFPVVLSSALFLIVGFYFSRTNHAAIGGVGVKPQEEYHGR